MWLVQFISGRTLLFGWRAVFMSVGRSVCLSGFGAKHKTMHVHVHVRMCICAASAALTYVEHH